MAELGCHTDTDMVMVLAIPSVRHEFLTQAVRLEDVTVADTRKAGGPELGRACRRLQI